MRANHRLRTFLLVCGLAGLASYGLLVFAELGRSDGEMPYFWVTWVLLFVVIGVWLARFPSTNAVEDGLLARLEKTVAELRSRPPGVYKSLHQVFERPDALRPRSGGRVDLVLDPTDLPPSLPAYLEALASSGNEARILLLDPDSDIVAAHRLTLESEGDVDYVRTKMRKAVAQLAGLATVRLYEAIPPGLLVIVDDHVILGGICAVPTDAPLPLVELSVDTREHVYWAFRRHFDALWDAAKPVDDASHPGAPSLVAGSM